jgi:hypothetical protein
VIWKICDKWELTVELEQAAATKGHRPFHEFPVSSMGRRAVCRERLLANLPQIETAVELFGGLGITSTILRNTQTLSDHVVSELNQDLVGHLARNGFNARQGDAFAEVSGYQGRDLLDCDFGLFTILQWRKNPELQEFADSAFNGGHRYLIWTDESISRLGVNREKYAAVFATETKNIKDYVNNWSKLWFSLYGYSILDAQHHRGATYTMWTRQEPVEVTPTKTTAEYEGVKVIEAVAV